MRVEGVEEVEEDEEEEEGEGGEEDAKANEKPASFQDPCGSTMTTPEERERNKVRDKG